MMNKSILLELEPFSNKFIQTIHFFKMDEKIHLGFLKGD